MDKNRINCPVSECPASAFHQRGVHGCLVVIVEGQSLKKRTVLAIYSISLTASSKLIELIV
jgi:hypothetical protein